jgi:hypothetical protein
VSVKRDVIEGITAVHASLRAVEQATLAIEDNTTAIKGNVEILMGQGQSASEANGIIMAKLGEILSRLDHYIDDANRQGARINTLERELREITADGR